MGDRPKQADVPLEWDDELRALWWATRHLPPPEPVRKASQAQSDLWERVKRDHYRPLTRDEKRLQRRYKAVHDAYVADAVQAYHNRH